MASVLNIPTSLDGLAIRSSNNDRLLSFMIANDVKSHGLPFSYAALGLRRLCSAATRLCSKMASWVSASDEIVSFLNIEPFDGRVNCPRKHSLL